MGVGKTGSAYGAGLRVGMGKLRVVFIFRGLRDGRTGRLGFSKGGAKEYWHLEGVWK